MNPIYLNVLPFSVQLHCLCYLILQIHKPLIPLLLFLKRLLAYLFAFFQFLTSTLYFLS
jgi:hypothetical protein